MDRIRIRSRSQSKNNLITLDYSKFRRFFKVSSKALDKKRAMKVIETILNKYKSKMNKLGYKTLNEIVYKEYKAGGYRGNLYNDSIWVRDAVSPFLLKRGLDHGNWQVVYKKL